MNEVLESIVRTKKVFGKEVIVVRPGVSLFLYSDTPLEQLGPGVADVLQLYLKRIPPNVINAYLAADRYKALTPKTLGQHVALLRNIPSAYEFVEIHYKNGVDPACGRYAFHFEGSRLGDADEPLETNLIVFEWPQEVAIDPKQAESVVEFARLAAQSIPIVSGNAGFAFQHPQTFPSEALDFIQQLMPRYLAFDPSYRRLRFRMRGHSPSAHWVNLVGEPLLKQIGGIEKLRTRISGAVAVSPVGGGALIQATRLPPVGDVNRGAPDLGSIPDVARVLRPLRFEITGFGGPSVDAASWLARFDNRQSVT
jgi:hypothetical protein